MKTEKFPCQLVTSGSLVSLVRVGEWVTKSRFSLSEGVGGGAG